MRTVRHSGGKDILYFPFNGLYRKEEMEVELHNLADGSPIGKVTAFVYIMDENRRTGQPDDWYYYTCEEGYLRFGFDTAILKIAYEESTGKKRGGAR